MFKRLKIESFSLGGKTIHLIGFTHGRATEKRVRGGATTQEQRAIKKYLARLEGSKTFLLELSADLNHPLTPAELMSAIHDSAAQLRHVPQVHESNPLPLEPVMLTLPAKLKKSFHREFAKSPAFQRRFSDTPHAWIKEGHLLEFRGPIRLFHKNPFLDEFRSLVFADTINTHVKEGGSDHIVALFGSGHLHSLKRYLKTPELMQKMLAEVPKTSSKFLSINREINEKLAKPTTYAPP